ncbi:FAD-dependent oxidoreductase [Archangium violaceum]|uniref:flavin monoamine oxidase family protein n=1 Tax=Archangium violaceum TaxID=83451 RepID=UPI00194FBDA6|nr:NAD(P)/FAD-dependent oxidoreductase [Archangium violaceum]QRO01467.1 FAD-dependent oxidoreductase [Archangium violaceum]
MHVVIIGGGAAGIAAAHTILGSSKSHKVTLFESRGTYGGRALTDDTSISGFAFDKGCQYIQDEKHNPWTAIAKELGFDTFPEKVDDVLRREEEDGKFVDEKTTAEPVKEVSDAIEASYEEARKQPNVIVARKPRLDTQAEMFGHAVSEFGPFTESAEVYQYIAADRARVVSYEGDGNAFVTRGLGTLVRAYGLELKKRFGDRITEYFQTPVGIVRYTGSGVTVVSRSGGKTVAADAVIITVPTSVLASGAIAFDPPLSKEYRSVFNILRLGSYKKLALKCNRIPDELEVDTNYYLIETEPEGVWKYYRLSKTPDVLVVHAAGDFAMALDGMADKDVFALFKKTLQEAYEGLIAYAPGKAITNWSRDPDALGAYSYTAMVGGGPSDPTALNARIQLKKPVSGTVHFTGEAASLGFYGTLSGAYDEGVATARAVLGVSG